MYLSSILWLLTWPLLIFVSYQTIRLLLNKYEKTIEQQIESKSNMKKS